VDPKSWIDQWFGRDQPSPDLAPALADLDRVAANRPELRDAAVQLGRVLAAAFGDVSPIEDQDWEALRDAWAAGQPAFQSHLPRLDPSRLKARLRKVVAAVGLDRGPAQAFARSLDSRNFDPIPLVAEFLSGSPGEVEGRLGPDSEVMASIFQMALLPDLAQVSARLDRDRVEGAWDRGDCPNCGRPPLLAESRGLEQRIYYRCGLCAGNWPGERLRCPSCGETDSRSLHYSFVEGEQDRARLAHCDACRSDWKVVSTLTALTAPAMIVADLATVHLDLIADDRREEPG